MAGITWTLDRYLDRAVLTLRGPDLPATTLLLRDPTDALVLLAGLVAAQGHLLDVAAFQQDMAEPEV